MTNLFKTLRRRRFNANNPLSLHNVVEESEKFGVNMDIVTQPGVSQLHTDLLCALDCYTFADDLSRFKRDVLEPMAKQGLTVHASGKLSKAAVNYFGDPLKPTYAYYALELAGERGQFVEIDINEDGTLTSNITYGDFEEGYYLLKKNKRHRRRK